ncbi:hypothetical protein ACXDF8_02900 [Mycolicibacterium sp. CBM1]
MLQTAAHEVSTREKLRRIVESQLMGVSQLGADELVAAVAPNLQRNIDGSLGGGAATPAWVSGRLRPDQ